LVFAYGSNLDVDQMFGRCPDSLVVGPAFLPGYSLEFVGSSHSWGGAVANVYKSSPGCNVPGMVYRVTLEDLRHLDACEGAPLVYQRIKAQVKTFNGKPRTVHVYLRDDDDLILGYPSVRYFRAIYRGYMLWQFHTNHITRLFRAAGYA
jgi:cation transport regulator ChaC